MNVDLKGLTAQETEKWATSKGLDPYRGRQIRRWMFKKFATSFDEMTDLPKSIRSSLKEKVNLTHLKKEKTLISKDTTEKSLFRLMDGHLIETVLIPERDHFTLCISSQAGCAMGCRFCLTARQGLKRNLSSAEIIDQVIQVRRSMDDPGQLTNIVFMGMGEPLANYDSVLKAIENLTVDDGMNFSHRKVTLSTCGLVPQIRNLGNDITVNLAVSLNAPSNRIRNYLMPINKKYPIEDLLSVCSEFPLPNRRRITFEYIMIKGINDRSEDAIGLANCLSKQKAKINLIPLNHNPDSEMIPSPIENLYRFQEILIKYNYTAIIRKSKGRDISAACGQLSGSHLDE